MVDTTFRTVLPALKAVDNLDGTYSVGVKLSSSSVYPTGRSATYVIAASDAPAHVKAQADYVCDGTADDVQIQAVIDAVNASGIRGSVQLLGETFYCSARLNAKSKVDMFGPSEILVVTNNNVSALDVDGITNALWRDITVRRQGAPGADQRCVEIHGATDETFKMENCRFFNEIAALSSCWGIRIYLGSPILINCEGKGGGTSGTGIRISGTAPTLINCRGYGADTNATSWQAGIFVEGGSPTLIGCVGTGGQGAGSGEATGIQIQGSGDVTLQSCMGIGGGTTTSSNSIGVTIVGTANVNATGLIGIGGSGTGADNAGIYIGNSNPDTLLSGLEGYGGINSIPGSGGIGFMEGDSKCKITGAIGKGSGNKPGIFLREGSSPVLVGCTGEGGDNGGPGFDIYDASSPSVSGCIGIGGSEAIDSYAFYIDGASAPTLDGCTGTPLKFPQKWSYDDANNGRFQPFAGHPYQLITAFVQVVNPAAAGATLELGTSIGGSEIASAIPIDVAGSQFIDFVKVEVAAASYMYATPSVAINDGDIIVYYSVITNYATSYGLFMGSIGAVRISNSSFYSNGASDAATIGLNAQNAKKYSITASHFETFDPVNQNALLFGGVGATVQPIFSSKLVGLIQNLFSFADNSNLITGFINPGHVKTASGALTGGAVNTIAFAWHNPEAQDILIKKVVINITTKGGTATAVIDCGIADDATYTNGGAEFFNDIDADAAAILHDSWIVGGVDFGTQLKWLLLQDSASATDGWIVAKILTEAAANLVGSWYLEYIGK